MPVVGEIVFRLPLSRNRSRNRVKMRLVRPIRSTRQGKSARQTSAWLFDLEIPNAWAASSTLAVPVQVARMCLVYCTGPRCW